MISVSKNEDSSSIPNNNNNNPNSINNHSSKEVVPQSKSKKKKKKIKLTDHQISKGEQEQIKSIFYQLFLFDVFPEKALVILLSNLLLFQVTPGSFFYKKGSKSKFFYIVLEGILEVYKDSNLIRLYHEKDSFGHSSLISNDHIIHLFECVKCIVNTKLFVLNREIFLSIKQKIIEFHMQQKYDFINTIIFFKTLIAS